MVTLLWNINPKFANYVKCVLILVFLPILSLDFRAKPTADFEATMNLIHEIGFDNSFSFIYSPRPGTPAANLPDDVSLEEKKKRLEIVQQRLMSQALAISQTLLNTTQNVLVDSVSKRNTDELAGRTENNRVVNFIGNTSLIGQIIPVKITAVKTNTLRGEMIC